METALCRLLHHPGLLTGRAAACALHARRIALEPAEPKIGNLHAPAVIQQDAAAVGWGLPCWVGWVGGED